MRVQYLVLALCAVAFASAALSRTNFESDLESYDYDTYLRDFGKATNSNSASYLAKKQIFQENLAEIIAHNSDPTQTWKMGVNQFTDMSEAERSTFLGLSSAAKPAFLNGIPAPEIKATVPLPEKLDWREKGVVTKVADQGGCGSCWAFAAVAALESAVALKTGKLIDLSQQNMVSCTENPRHCGGTGGCGGATCELGYSYVKDKGLALAKDYPYTASDSKCDETKKKAVTIDSWVTLPLNNYTALVNALVEVGPIAVGIHANPLFAYSSGVFTGCKFTGNIDVNHAVVAVGWGNENGQDYWIIRNSWGRGWGESGYIRVLKHSDGSSKWCGEDKTPEHGDACEGDPPGPITVCGSCGLWSGSSFPVGARLV